VCSADTTTMYTVGYATTKQCYNEQFLSIKSGCYNERGGILFITGSSIIVFTRERYFMFILFIMESLFIIFTEERLFMLFKFTCTEYIF
jgi:hypothetical protein